MCQPVFIPHHAQLIGMDGSTTVPRESQVGMQSPGPSRPPPNPSVEFIDVVVNLPVAVHLALLIRKVHVLFESLHLTASCPSQLGYRSPTTWQRHSDYSFPFE